MKHAVIVMFSITIFMVGMSLDAHAQEPTNVTIGGLLPHDESGQHRIHATNEAIKDFNEYLKEKGTTDWFLSVDVRDTNRMASIALEATKDFIADDIKYVVGPSGSASVNAIQQHIKEDNIDLLVISCCSTSPTIAENDSIFRLAPSDDKQGPVIANLLQKSDKEFMIPVWVDDPFGNGLVDTTSAAFEALGGTVIRDPPLSYECGKSDPDCNLKLEPLAESLNRLVLDNILLHGAESVAILYVGFHMEDLAREAVKHDALGMVTWAGSDADVLKSHLVSDENSDVRELLVDVNFQNQIFDPDENSPRHQSLEKSLQERFPGAQFSTYAYASYDAVWAVGLALERAGGPNADFDKIVSVTQEAIESNTEGALGSISLNENGDIDTAIYGVYGIVETAEEPEGTWVKIGTFYPNNIFIQEFKSPLETINMGVLLELTGPASFNDPDYGVAMTLARQDFNDLSDTAKIHITTIDTSTGILGSLNTLHSGTFDSFYHDKIRKNINDTIAQYRNGDFKAINDQFKDGPNSAHYPFVINEDGLTRAHGYDSSHVDMTNFNGLNPDRKSDEIHRILSGPDAPDELWTQYEFSKPGEDSHTTKRSLFVYHEESNLLVGAGYHPVLGGDEEHRTPLEDVIDKAAMTVKESSGNFTVLLDTFSYDTADEPFYAFAFRSDGYVIVSAAATEQKVFWMQNLTTLDKSMEQIRDELPNTNDTTWISYIFTNPANGLEEEKRSLIKRVTIYDNGTDHFFAAGYYPVDKLLHFVGPTTSGNTAKIKPYVQDNDLIIVSPSSTAESLAIPKDNIFRLTPSDLLQVAALAELATNEDKTHLVIVNRDDVWANGISDALAMNTSFTSYRGDDTDGDGKPDSMLIPVEDGRFNYDGLAERLARQVEAAVNDADSLDNVTVLYVGFDQSMISLFNAIDRLADPRHLLDVNYYGTDGVANDADILEDPATARITSGAGFSATIFDVQPNAINGKLKDRIDRLGVNFNSYSSSSYDSVTLLASAIENSNERMSVRDILASTSGYRGALNDNEGITLNEAGDLSVRATDYTIFSIVEQDGDHVWVKDVEASDGSIEQQLDAISAKLADLADQINNIQATIMDQQRQIDALGEDIERLDSITKITGTDGSYIVLDKADAYYIGDTITVKAFVASPYPSETHLDYGLFLVAGADDNSPDNEFQAAGYLGRLLGEPLFGTSDGGSEFYGEGFYCNGAADDFNLKFIRDSSLMAATYSEWNHAEPAHVPCPYMPNTEFTYTFEITDQYRPGDNYALVFGTDTSRGIISPVFAINAPN